MSGYGGMGGMGGSTGGGYPQGNPYGMRGSPFGNSGMSGGMPPMSGFNPMRGTQMGPPPTNGAPGTKIGYGGPSGDPLSSFGGGGNMGGPVPGSIGIQNPGASSGPPVPYGGPMRGNGMPGYGQMHDLFGDSPGMPSGMSGKIGYGGPSVPGMGGPGGWMDGNGIDRSGAGVRQGDATADMGMGSHGMGDYSRRAEAMYGGLRSGMGGMGMGGAMPPDMGNKMMQQPPAPPAMYASGAPMGGGGGLQFDAQGNVIRPGIPPSQPLGDAMKTGPVTPQEIHNGQFDPASSPTYLQGPTASLFGGANGPPSDPRMVWGMGNAGGMRGYNLVPGWNGYTGK